ncbi:unnamed protein product [Urochloa decumbens]|uniref:Uncharacterized protein n=1 Tax=Urochloa decumbens TaxID=240449 RepID=A0ABC9FKJ2_9POAL
MDDISTGLSNLERILDGSKRPGKLKLCVLSHITAKFSDERKIGEGGCGQVYKGILPSGQTVAVKKLLNAKTMDDRMFEQEVTTMMRTKNQNIVRFLGYCSHIEERAMKIQGKYILVEERERLLCFDYMINGSLAEFITDELRGLEWHTRFQIIKGICNGLHHLHNEKGIIHMDLKPPNILLDGDLVPKITDFGISRAGEISKTMSQERLCSLGYCAPEYLFNGKISFKSDIYSLGVIIIEMVTGRREEPNIAIVHRRWRHMWKKIAKHTTLGYQRQVTKCLELAQRCKNQNRTERPNIHDIIRTLNEVDNTDWYISDTKSTIEQKNSFLEDMLGIDPLELHFSAELNKKISHSIQLINDTDDYVAFRITLGEKNIASRLSATRQLPFCMLPNNKDVLRPWSSFSVTITLEALKKPLREEHRIAELYVQSTRVNKDVTAQDITESMFKEGPGKVVDTVNLMVRVDAPKHLLVVEPLELRYWPIELDRLLPRSLQLTNRTDDYVAFMFILPEDKVLYFQTMGMGIMPPWSSRGIVIETLVKETLSDMQYKDTCLVRSVVVDKDLRNESVTVDLFYEQMGVHEMELDIMFAEQPQALSSVHYPLYNEQYWEDDELELTEYTAVLIRPFSIETELLHIYPSELRFTSEEGEEYMSLINTTEDDIMCVINYSIQGEYRIGVVPPQSTRAVLVSSRNEPYQLGVMMISGSCRYRTADDIRSNYTYNKREELMNQVRAEGGKAHEALLVCVVHAPHPAESVATTKQHEVTLLMDDYSLGDVYCMDVHPTEPWVVTAHHGGGVCVWKIDPKTSACETMLSSAANSKFIASSVKFIARMQWVACGDYGGYITVYTYAENRLTEIMKFRAHHKDDGVRPLAVHSSLPYLLSSSKANLIKLWDWDQGWMCTRIFSCSSTSRYYMCEMVFNPKDANSFACLDNHGEIKIWSIDSEGPTICLRGLTDTVGIAYCDTGSDVQCLATVGWKGKIEILNLRSNTTTHVHTLEAMGLLGKRATRFITCHPTHPLLATGKADTGVFLWNYTTYGLKKVRTFKHDCFEIVGLGFVNIEGFQRLLIAYSNKIEMVDIFHGATFPRHSQCVW